jgi:hypothetical protein
MTLDVTIGKLKGTRYLDQCPNAETDISNPKLSYWSRESYRSGSTEFWSFWLNKNAKLAKIYMNMRKNPWTNDFDRSKLKPFEKEILSIPESEFPDEVDKDRLRWLKYWVAKAIELYGDKAGITFS